MPDESLRSRSSIARCELCCGSVGHAWHGLHRLSRGPATAPWSMATACWCSAGRREVSWTTTWCSLTCSRPLRIAKAYAHVGFLEIKVSEGNLHPRFSPAISCSFPEFFFHFHFRIFSNKIERIQWVTAIPRMIHKAGVELFFPHSLAFSPNFGNSINFDIFFVLFLFLLGYNFSSTKLFLHLDHIFPKVQVFINFCQIFDFFLLINSIFFWNKHAQKAYKNHFPDFFCWKIF